MGRRDRGDRLATDLICDGKSAIRYDQLRDGVLKRGEAGAAARLGINDKTINFGCGADASSADRAYFRMIGQDGDLARLARHRLGDLRPIKMMIGGAG